MYLCSQFGEFVPEALKCLRCEVDLHYDLMCHFKWMQQRFSAKKKRVISLSSKRTKWLRFLLTSCVAVSFYITVTPCQSFHHIKRRLLFRWLLSVRKGTACLSRNYHLALEQLVKASFLAFLADWVLRILFFGEEHLSILACVQHQSSPGRVSNQADSLLGCESFSD